MRSEGNGAIDALRADEATADDPARTTLRRPARRVAGQVDWRKLDTRQREEPPSVAGRERRGEPVPKVVGHEPERRAAIEEFAHDVTSPWRRKREHDAHVRTVQDDLELAAGPKRQRVPGR